VGTVNCDELSLFFQEEVGVITTCNMLWEEFDCDCSGCECSAFEPPSPAPEQCANNCAGSSCDDWDSFLGGGVFSCSNMETLYGCDCTGCECVGGHGECLAATFDDVSLCEIGGEARTCDEWQTYEKGGASLTCQYLEFYFSCDCTGCQCAGEPLCGVDGIGTVRQ
jgi:hypothetical protein